MATLILAWSGIAAAQPPDPAADSASEIRAREEALFRAMHTRDRARLEALLADDYILRSAPDVDRKTWIQNALTLCWGDRLDIDRFEAQRHDRVAIASFEITFYEDPVTCKPAILRSVVTDIWIEQDAEWRLQMRHAAPPPLPGAGVVPQYGIVPAPPPVWEMTSELSFVATGGNTSTRTTGVSADLNHRSDGMSTRASVAFLSSRSAEVLRAESLSMQARQGFRLGGRFQAFAEGSYLRDQFAGIDGRTTATLGLGYSPALKRPHTLSIESGAGITAEQRVNAPDLRFATASGAARYAWEIVPGTRLTQEVVFNADLELTRNWRSTSATAVHLTLSRLLSVKASHTIEYRNAPVAGFLRTDMRTAAALVLSLRR